MIDELSPEIRERIAIALSRIAEHPSVPFEIVQKELELFGFDIQRANFELERLSNNEKMLQTATEDLRVLYGQAFENFGKAIEYLKIEKERNDEFSLAYNVLMQAQGEFGEALRSQDMKRMMAVAISVLAPTLWETWDTDTPDGDTPIDLQTDINAS